MTTHENVEKDSTRQRPIPSAWRDTLSRIADALRANDFSIAREIPCVSKPPADVAQSIERSIGEYGDRLVGLSDAVWATSACQWMDGYWDVYVDLCTENEEPSDLALFVRVTEARDGYSFDVLSVHVP